MDGVDWEGVIAFGGVILVVVILAAIGILRNRPVDADDEDVAPTRHPPVTTRQAARHVEAVDLDEPEDPMQPRHDHPWAFGLLGLALAANAALGALLYNVYREVSESRDRIEQAVAQGEDRIEQEIAAAIALIPDVSVLSRELDEQSRVNVQQQAALDEIAAEQSRLGFTIDPRDIDIPFFCSGEIAVWDPFAGLSC